MREKEVFGLSEDNNKKKSRMDELDEFWDISSLVPRKNVSPYRKPSIDTSAAQISAAPSAKEQKSEEKSPKTFQKPRSFP